MSASSAEPPVEARNAASEPVAAVVAAAGFSRRMGRFKPLLPWGRSTVIESAAAALARGGASPALVVTGHRGAEIAARLEAGAAVAVFNADYARNSMLRSYQVGIEALQARHPSALGALLALGDQPHLPAWVIRRIVERARREPEAVVAPSHAGRRGHPIYLPRRLFAETLRLQEGQTLRDLLQRREREIVYAAVESDCIRRDIDHPSDYEELRAQYDHTARSH